MREQALLWAAAALCVGCTAGGGDSERASGRDGALAPDGALEAGLADAGADAEVPLTDRWAPVPGLSAREVVVDADGVLWIAAADGVWRHDGEALTSVPFDSAVEAPDIYGLDVRVDPPLAAGADGPDAEVFTLLDGRWTPTALEGRRFDAANVGRFTQIVGRGSDLFALAPGLGVYEYRSDGLFGSPVFLNVNEGPGGSLTGDNDRISALFRSGSHTILVGTASNGVHQFCDLGGRGGGAWCADTTEPNGWADYPLQSTARLLMLGDALYSLGAYPPLMARDAPVAMPFVPAQWQAVPVDLPDDVVIEDAVGTSTDDLWLVGRGDLVARGGLDNLRRLDVGAGAVDWVSVAVRPDPAGVDVWLVAANGLVLRCQGACDEAAARCDDPACINLPEAGLGEPCAEPGQGANCAEGLRCTRLSLCGECDEDAHCAEGRNCIFSECQPGR